MFLRKIAFEFQLLPSLTAEQTIPHEITPDQCFYVNGHAIVDFSKLRIKRFSDDRTLANFFPIYWVGNTSCSTPRLCLKASLRVRLWT